MARAGYVGAEMTRGGRPRAARGRLALVATVLAGCATTSTVPSAPPGRAVFVAPTGDDAARGSESSPFRTIGRALAVADASPITLAPGNYDDEIEIDRPVTIAGAADGAILGGHVRISGRAVKLAHLTLARGLSVSAATDAVLEDLKVQPAGTPHTIQLTGSAARLQRLDVECGAETCLEISSSTVTLSDSQLRGARTAKRGLRVETGSVSLERVEISGTTINQVLARAARLAIRQSRLVGAFGTGLAAVARSRLVARGVTVEGATNIALLVESSRAEVERSSFGAPKGIAVGISGGEVDLVDSTFGPAAQGALSVSNHGNNVAAVRLTGGEVQHGTRAGVLLAQGELTVRGTHFTGDPAARTDGEDAVAANGPDAVLRVLGARIDAPAGFGVSLTHNAAATITATISRARLGGVFLEGVAGSPVLVKGGRIESCRIGSGVVIRDATDVSIEGASILGCPEAGVLAGQGSSVSVSDAALAGNGHYGIAAFGGAVVELARTRVKGSRWAVFASCGDEARVEDGGGNRLDGPSSTCQ